jgi:hypothetical protein
MMKFYEIFLWEERWSSLPLAGRVRKGGVKLKSKFQNLKQITKPHPPTPTLSHERRGIPRLPPQPSLSNIRRKGA